MSQISNNRIHALENLIYRPCSFDVAPFRRMNAVRAFEAAARLGSFKEAAAELGVTHGAVSQQIRLLEDVAGPAIIVPAIGPARWC